MLVAFSVAPSAPDHDGSFSRTIAEVVRLVRASGLPHRTDAMFTTIEGDWDACMGVVKGAVDLLTAQAPRVSLVLKADIRPGHTGELTGKVQRVEALLAQD